MKILIACDTFVAKGTKILTYDGIKTVEEVKVGDLVLTHKGRYKRVQRIEAKESDSFLEMTAETGSSIKYAPNSLFYTNEIRNVYGNRRYTRKFGEYVILPSENFITEYLCSNKHGAYKKKTYVATVTDNIENTPEYNGVEIGVNAFKTELRKTLKVATPSFWYIVGRWIGDGWFYYQYSHGRKRLAGIRICCNKSKAEYVGNKIREAGFNYYLSEERTVNKFEIANKELGLYIKQFGEYAYGKTLPGFVLRLPCELALAFLEGYLETDGHCDEKGNYSFSTISEDLAYGIKYMINKYYGVSCSIKKSDNHSCIIEGRKCNTRPIYISLFRKDKRKQSRYMVDGQNILCPFKTVIPVIEKTEMFGLSVEEDESYTANGFVMCNYNYAKAMAEQWS